jgi:hypothetical protein
MPLDERPGELPLEPHDLVAILLERLLATVARAEALAFAQKPSEEILEGFHRERMMRPARGRGRRGWCCAHRA